MQVWGENFPPDFTLALSSEERGRFPFPSQEKGRMRSPTIEACALLPLLRGEKKLDPLDDNDELPNFILPTKVGKHILSFSTLDFFGCHRQVEGYTEFSLFAQDFNNIL
jgi:hypothetical protein